MKASLGLAGKKGFTLVELTVVLVIIGVMLAAGVVGVAAYSDYAEFRENNECARTIFMAAQSSLTHMKSMGQLEKLQAKMTDENAITLRDTGDSGRQIFYMLLSASDQASREKCPESFHMLLDGYMYDASVLDDASIAIELDPADGVVRAVYYSKRASYFAYEGTVSERAVSLPLTDYNERKRIQLGYYSTELSESAPRAYPKPVISYVKLENKETLELSFSLSSAFKSRTGELAYTIELYDDENKRHVIISIPTNTLRRSATQQVDIFDGGNIIELECSVDSTYGGATEKLVFPVYVTRNDEVHIVLDAVDIRAGVQRAKSEPDYSSTYSAMRLMKLATFDMLDKVYARVQATGEMYSASAWKQSPSEHLLMGKNSVTALASLNFTLQNARHLFNLRFMGAVAKLDGFTEAAFTETASFAWRGMGGLLQNGFAANAEGGKAAEDTSFMPIEGWNEDFTFTARANTVISGITLDAMKIEGYYQTASAIKYEHTGFGLFETNAGTLSGITLASLDVDGRNGGTPYDNVGGVVGLNMCDEDGVFCDGAKLSALTVKNGTVCGRDYVGGIVGRSQKKIDRRGNYLNSECSYEGLTNGADVSGERYVGGITGYATGTESKKGTVSSYGTVTECKNTGFVYAIEPQKGDGRENVFACAIGGIAGKNDGANITKCTSAPGQASLKSIADADLLAYRVGSYVGGISGLNIKGAVTDCQTTGGYVIGAYHVGGLIGVNAANADLAGTSNKTENSATVIARGYAGGIVGVNAYCDYNEDYEVCTFSFESEDETYTNPFHEFIKHLIPSNIWENFWDWIFGGSGGGNNKSQPTLTNFRNTGLVCASESCAGGITGYNMGTLTDCAVSVDTTSTSGKAVLERVRALSASDDEERGWIGADFVGGVVGRNDGTVSAQSVSSVNTVLAGRDFVGGVVGYNSEGAKLSNYRLTGGYIAARDFAGGLMGANAEEGVYSGVTLKVSPNTLSGRYFVGGIVGASVVQHNGSTDNNGQGNRLGFAAELNNFTGTIEAPSGAFVGGLIGYNCILDKKGNTDDFIEKMNEAVKMAESDSDPAVRADNIADAIGKLGYERSDKAALTIGGGSSTVFRLSSIEGGLYVGGVIGMNDVKTHVNIENVENRTNITATLTIPENAESESMLVARGGKWRLSFRNDTSEFEQFSYSGGIIGRATEYTKITSCRNNASTAISHNGTYKGSLVEVNEGLIDNCIASAFGAMDSPGGIGGLVGLNRDISEKTLPTNGKTSASELYAANGHSGIICNSTVTGAITGSSMVGGIAAINRGYIVDCNVNAPVRGAGNFVGGFTAINEGMILGTNEESSKLSASVMGGGERIGGFAGYNAGSLINCTMAKSGITVTGASCTGGFIGAQAGVVRRAANDTVSYYITDGEGKACAVAQYSLGGYWGWGLDEDAYDCYYVPQLDKLINYAAVTASVDHAGGIAGCIECSRAIGSYPMNDSVSADMDGIVGLTNCVNYGLVTLTSTSGGAAGGIVSKVGLKSKLTDCAVYEEVIARGSENLGFIAAVNHGTIERCQAGTDKTLSIVGSGSIGALVGENSGTITDCAAINVSVSDVTGAEDTNIGGLVGCNHTLAAADSADGAAHTGIIENCRTGTVTRNGNYSTFAKGSITVIGNNPNGSLGGVTGRNEGVIRTTNTEFADTDGVPRSYVNARVELVRGAAYTGGVAGLNTGSIDNILFAGSVSAPGSENYGYGLIAGVNGDGNAATAATITGCRVNDDSDKFPALTTDSASDYNVNTYATLFTNVNGAVSVGGIAGYNMADGVIDDCTLIRAYVFGHYGRVGGIVGLNDGKVVDCIAPTAKDGAQSTPLNVKVYMQQGDIGGIIGRNTRTGAVNDCATGRDWLTIATKSPVNSGNTESTDNTCAGIIGYNATDKKLSGLNNYGSVLKNLGSSVAVGGIIGRQENLTTNTWVIDDCHNRGSVEGGERVSGIIGNWKYNGGTISNCTNAKGAKVQGKNIGTGGIIGFTYGPVNGAVLNIVNCANLGTIAANAGPVGGLFGATGASLSGKYTVNITSCYNDGDVTGTGNRGGIYGAAVNNGGILNVSRCVNYYPFEGETGGLGGGTGNATIRKCVCVPYIAEPMAPGYTSSADHLNYYLIKDGTAPFKALPLYVMKAGWNGPFIAVAKDADGEPTSVRVEALPCDTTEATHANNVIEADFDKVKAAIDNFYKAMFDTDAEMPKNVTLNVLNGSYYVKWDTMVAYYFEVTIETSADGVRWTPLEGSTMETEFCELYFLPDYTKIPKGHEKIRVRVRSANGNAKDKPTPSNSFSAYADSTSVSLLEALPTPVVHFEMRYEIKNGALNVGYVCILDNADDYKDIGGEVKITAKLTDEDTQIFLVSDGRSDFFAQKKGGNTNTTVEAVAEANDTLDPDMAKYMQSSKYSVQTQSRSYANDLSSNSLSSLTQSTNPIYGVTPDTLEARVKVSGSMDKQIYRRTEFFVPVDAPMGEDPEAYKGYTVLRDENGVATLTLPVVLSMDETRITATHNITLGNLGSMVGGQAYVIRSYSWGTQNLAVMYGHDVASSLAPEELRGLNDDVLGEGHPVLTEDRLNPGYVVKANTDGTFDVYYSFFLALKEDPAVNKNSQILRLSLKMPAQAEKPVLSDTFEILEELGLYRFSWTTDARNIPVSAFEVSATGITVAGTRVPINLGAAAIVKDTEVKNKSAFYIDLDPSVWNYNKVELTVTRLGTSNSNGTTNKLSSTSDDPVTGPVSYTVPMPLPSVAIPIVTLDSKLNDLLYTVSWIYADTLALEDTVGYKVFATYTNADGTLCYAVAGGTGDGTADVTDETPIATINDAGTKNAVIDLEGYQGSELEIYVVALVTDAEGRSYNRDSFAGGKAETEVARRLVASAVEISLTPNGTDPLADTVTMAAFTDPGMTLEAKGGIALPGFAESPIAGFVMQAAIFDASYSTLTASAIEEMTEEDARMLKAIAWGDTRLALNAQGTPDNLSIYAFDGLDPALYAGRYIAVRVRAASSSAVSSLWSDYYWFRLPKAQLDKAKIEVNDADVTETAHNAENEIKHALTATRHAMQWEWDKLASNYTLAIGTEHVLSFEAKYGTDGEPEIDKDGLPVILVTAADCEATLEVDESAAIRLDSSSIVGETAVDVYRYTAYSINAAYLFDGITYTAAFDTLITVTRSAESVTLTVTLPDYARYFVDGGDEAHDNEKDMPTRSVTVATLPKDNVNYTEADSARYGHTHNDLARYEYSSFGELG